MFQMEHGGTGNGFCWDERDYYVGMTEGVWNGWFFDPLIEHPDWAKLINLSLETCPGKFRRT